MAQLTPAINATTGLATLPARSSPFYKVFWSEVTTTKVANGITTTSTKKIVQKPRYDTTDVNAYFNVLAGDTWADIQAAATTVGVTLPTNPNIGP